LNLQEGKVPAEGSIPDACSVDVPSDGCAITTAVQSGRRNNQASEIVAGLLGAIESQFLGRLRASASGYPIVDSDECECAADRAVFAMR
jgi:hypothetical protein